MSDPIRSDWRQAERLSNAERLALRSSIDPDTVEKAFAQLFREQTNINENELYIGAFRPEVHFGFLIKIAGITPGNHWQHTNFTLRIIGISDDRTKLIKTTNQWCNTLPIRWKQIPPVTFSSITTLTNPAFDPGSGHGTHLETIRADFTLRIPTLVS